MSMKKTLKSDAEFVIMGNSSKQAELFPIGYEYLCGEVIYTVTDRFTSDNTEWRRLRATDGTVQDVTVATILEDLNVGRPITKQGVMKAFKPNKAVRVIKDPDEVDEVEEVEAVAPVVAPEPKPVVKRTKSTKRVVKKASKKSAKKTSTRRRR